MDNYLPVEGMDGFYRDVHSGAIVNKNNSEYESYVAQREKQKKEKQNFDSLQSEVNDIKYDVDQIKSMLNTITDLLNK